MNTHPWLKQYPAYMPAEITPPPFDSLPSMIEDACKKYSTLSAASNMDKHITFAELNTLANHFAAFLQNDCHLKPGDRIAIQMPNLLQFPVAMLGALKAGLIVVNTNPLYTPREMEHQFKDSGAIAIVILANFAHNLEKVIGQTAIKTIIVTEVGDLMGGFKKLLVNFMVKNVKKMVKPYSLPGAISFSTALSKGAGATYKPVPIKKESVHT